MAKAILDNSIDAQITSDTKDGDRYVNFQNGRKYLDREKYGKEIGIIL